MDLVEQPLRVGDSIKPVAREEHVGGRVGAFEPVAAPCTATRPELDARAPREVSQGKRSQEQAPAFEGGLLERRQPRRDLVSPPHATPPRAPRTPPAGATGRTGCPRRPEGTA